MIQRIDKDGLFNVFSAWDGFLMRKVHLIACGGTAMTLLGVKESTKDVDLVIPDIAEFDYFIEILKQLGYKSVSGWGWAKEGGFIFDIFRGKAIHTTELLESPLEEGKNIKIKEYSHIYLGALNFYDLLISKLFRATEVDIDDCLSLTKAKRDEIDIDILAKRFRETASFDVSENRVNANLDHFMKVIKKEGLYEKRK